MKRASLLRQTLRLIRFKQWIKNFFVFFPLIFSISFFSTQLIVKSLLATLAFCFASSAGYIVNDVFDREKDRRHPLKKTRPIASGAVSPPAALLLSLGLLGLAVCLALFASWSAAVVTAVYVLLCLAYSALFKNIVFMDVLAISLGFVLRVVAGALAIGVSLSNWFLLATLFLSLFMGLGKRRHDLLLLSDKQTHRPVLENYSVQLLDYCIVVSIALIIITYSLYTVAEETVRRFKTEALVYTVPLVVYGVFRYMFLVYKRDQGGDPSEIALKDKSLIVCVLLWTAAVIVILSLSHWSNGA